MSTQSLINSARATFINLAILHKAGHLVALSNTGWRLPARTLKRVRSEVFESFKDTKKVDGSCLGVQEFAKLSRPARKHNEVTLTTFASQHGASPRATAHMEGCEYGYYMYGDKVGNNWFATVHQGGVKGTLFRSPMFKTKKLLNEWIQGRALEAISNYGTSL